MSENTMLWILLLGGVGYLIYRARPISIITPSTALTVNKRIIFSPKGYSASGLYDASGNPLPALTSGYDASGNWVVS